jgi:predicted alpha/beta hydrolase family esterase
MRDRAFIIHGYQGYPQEAWLPWLKGELEERGFDVSLPSMPHPEGPGVPEWVEFITRLVVEPDKATVMIGHSLGSRAVVLYLESLGAANKSVGKTVLVASGFPTGLSAADAERVAGEDRALIPWFTIGAEASKVKKAAGRCTVILSDDDPIVSFGEAKASFAGNLDAQIVVEHSKGHLNEDSGLTELPSVLRAVVS